MTMSFMFENTEFNHNVSNWNINPRCSIEYMFDNCNIIDEYKPKKLKNKYKKYNFNLCLYIVKL